MRKNSRFSIEDEPAPEHIDIIPLEDELPAEPAKKPAKPASAEPAKAPGAGAKDETVHLDNQSAKPEAAPEEEDAVAQFLMDLKLDDED